MVDFYRPLSSEVAAPTTAGTSLTVNRAGIVRAVNTNASTGYLVTLVDSNLADSASMTLAPQETVLIPKEHNSRIYAANGNVKLTKVTSPKG